MNNAAIGSRPSDPSKISFDRDCFEVAGYETFYTVGRSALYSGPARFSSRDEAAAYARKCRRSVTEHRREVLRRVRWF